MATKWFNSIEELAKAIRTGLIETMDDLRNDVTDVVVDEVQPRSVFPVAAMPVDESPVKKTELIGPDLHNDDELEQFYIEETAGPRPYGTATAAMKHKPVMIKKLRDHGVKGIS